MFFRGQHEGSEQATLHLPAALLVPVRSVRMLLAAEVQPGALKRCTANGRKQTAPEAHYLQEKTSAQNHCLTILEDFKSWTDDEKSCFVQLVEEENKKQRNAKFGIKIHTLMFSHCSRLYVGSAAEGCALCTLLLSE